MYYIILNLFWFNCLIGDHLCKKRDCFISSVLTGWADVVFYQLQGNLVLNSIFIKDSKESYLPKFDLASVDFFLLSFCSDKVF